MKKLLLANAVASALAFAAAPAQAAQTTRYVLMAGDGKVAGEQVVERSDSGLTTVRFIFKDNGRGPELSERIQMLPDGTFSSYEVQGASTFGAPVNERFTRSGDKAEWQSTSERGAGTVAGPALYVGGVRPKPIFSAEGVKGWSTLGSARPPCEGRPELARPLGLVGVQVDRGDGQRRMAQVVTHGGCSTPSPEYWPAPLIALAVTTTR